MFTKIELYMKDPSPTLLPTPFDKHAKPTLTFQNLKVAEQFMCFAGRLLKSYLTKIDNRYGADSDGNMVFIQPWTPVTRKQPKFSRAHVAEAI